MIRQKPFRIEDYYHRKVRYVLDSGIDPLIEYIRDSYLPEGGTTYEEALAFEHVVTTSACTVEEFLVRCRQ